MSFFTVEERERDPELTALYDAFAGDEVPSTSPLPARTHHLAVLAALLGCQGVDEFTLELGRALDDSLGPVEVKEVLYQSIAYLGMGRVRPFLAVTDEVLRSRGTSLPLAPQGTTTPEGRREKGTQIQVELFGEHMASAWRDSDIRRFLASNCFGDYYSRTGLDLDDRELITFCFLIAQGGCEPQATSHAVANLARGNDEKLLTDVVSHLVPYIGYPRSLNALACIDDAITKTADH